MSRNKGIAAVILGILVCGILITSYTTRLVERQAESMAQSQELTYSDGSPGRLRYGRSGAETAQAADGGQPGDKAPEMEDVLAAAEIQKAAGSVETEVEMEAAEAADFAGESVAGETAAAPAGDAPALASALEETTAGAAPGGVAIHSGRSAAEQAEQASIEADEGAGPGLALEESAGGTAVPEKKKTAEDYRTRLEEIDSQIADQRSRNDGTTTYDMWAMAENERKLWDSELNSIYSVIKSHIPEGELEALVKDERAWIVSRDAKASEDAGKYAGGTLESVEYSASLAASTRDRAYYLVETYGEYLW